MFNYSFLVKVVLWMDYFCAFLITTQSNWFYFSWLFLKLFKAFLNFLCKLALSEEVMAVQRKIDAWLVYLPWRKLDHY